MRRQFFFLTLIFALGGTVATAQETLTLTAKDAVRLAIRNSPTVRNALLDIQIQEQTNREVTSAALPQITGTGQVTDFLAIPTQQLPGEIVGQPAGTFIPVKFGTKWNASFGAQLSQLLFDGQVFIGLQARDASMRMVTMQKNVTEEQIGVNVEKIYYQIIVGERQITSLDANISRFQKLLNDTKIIFKNGFVEKLDVDKVTVQLNNIETEKSKVRNQLDRGYAGLKFLMNVPQSTTVVLADTLSLDQVQAGILDSSYDVKNRKEYQLLQTLKELRNFNIKRYQLSQLPTVALFSNFSTNAQRSQFNFFNGERWFNTAPVGLNISMPIFDGFARRARIQRARLEYQKTVNDEANLVASIDNDIVQSRLSWRTAMLTLENQQRNVQLAESVYNTTKLKYEQGLGSNQEIYNAQTELRVAQNNYYSALYDAIVAKVDYEKASGTFTY